MSSYLHVLVIPKSNRSVVAGKRGDDLLLRVNAVPEGGKANAAVCKLLAKELKIPKTSITVVKGKTSRKKLIEITSLDQAQIDTYMRAIETQDTGE